jgi:hypothetical protein
MIEATSSSPVGAAASDSRLHGGKFDRFVFTALRGSDHPGFWCAASGARSPAARSANTYFCSRSGNQTQRELALGSDPFSVRRIAQAICETIDPPPVDLGDGHLAWCHFAGQAPLQIPRPEAA